MTDAKVDTIAKKVGLNVAQMKKDMKALIEYEFEF